MGKPPSSRLEKKPAIRTEETFSSLSENDEKALADFCADINIDNITFDEWKAVGSNLDIQIPLFVSQEELLSDSKKTIKFVRSIKKNQKIQKKQVSIQVSWKKGKSVGDRIRIKDAGDISDNLRGDLFVILKLAKKEI